MAGSLWRNTDAAPILPDMFSVLDLFSIGVGPSSSHTVGPMLATRAFAEALRERGVLPRVAHVAVTLYGSLALTGLGHGTDRAAVAGLEGNDPKTVDVDYLADLRARCEARGAIDLDGVRTIPFNFAHDVVLDGWHRLAAHPNGLRCIAYDMQDGVVFEQVWYSIGGGFIQQGLVGDPVLPIHAHDARAEQAAKEAREGEYRREDDLAGVPHPFTSADELLAICADEHKSIAQVVRDNETALHGADVLDARLDAIWEAMRSSVVAGCTSTQRTLPGGLD
ncbi:serine dehydratase, partial [Bifidobacterium choerinum]